MILCLRTDQPEVELSVYDDGQRVAYDNWLAERTLARDLLARCIELTAQAGTTLTALTGLVVWEGPGSFTGLRIGCTVANTIAASGDLPIVGTSGEAWISEGLARLARGDNDRMVIPVYGAPPRISQAKK